MTTCRICGAELTNHELRNEFYWSECPRCGPFNLTEDAWRDVERPLRDEPEKRALISHAINRMHNYNFQQFVEVSAPIFDEILSNHDYPTPSEQLYLLACWLDKMKKHFGQEVVVNSYAISSVGARNDEEFVEIVREAEERQFIITRKIGPTESSFSKSNAVFKKHSGLVEVSNNLLVKLTLKGTEYLEKQQRGNTESFTAFMAMKFGDSVLDAIYRDHFKPAARETGFNLKRLDEEQPAGLIDDHLRVEIRQARFLIADLTHENNGAYWEAGFAEGLGKHVIYTCSQEAFDKKSVHFDANHHLIVIWDPKDIGKATSKLKATIRATFPGVARMAD